MTTNKKHEMVLFSGYAKLPEGITATEMYKVIALVVVVDVSTGLIVEADCTLATELARKQVSNLLVGFNLGESSEELQASINRKYQGSAKKAIITAIRIITDKYHSYKISDEEALAKDN